MLDAITKVGGEVSLARGSQPQSSAPDFAKHLVGVVRDAEASAIGAMQGQVPMQDVVLKVMEAERTFATAMAIRDKAVAAYLELSRMQI